MRNARLVGRAFLVLARDQVVVVIPLLWRQVVNGELKADLVHRGPPAGQWVDLDDQTIAAWVFNIFGGHPLVTQLALDKRFRVWERTVTIALVLCSPRVDHAFKHWP